MAFDLDDEELRATRMMNGADRKGRVNKMKQDIKNLQEIINLCNEELDNEDENVTAVLDLVDLKSLRNLINRNKELEEYYEEQNKVNAKFIPVSLVEEKIEKLKQERTLKYDNYMGYKIESREQQDIDKKVQVLQELLEKRK